MNAGVGQDRIRTLSYGEDKPKDFGHDEAAWAQNRRAEFILLRPKN
jgi:peptidoglycan-associated lipoprotein